MHADGKDADLIRILGEIAISVWHLGYLVDEIGLQLGQDVGRLSAAGTREMLRRHVEREELPPWVHGVDNTVIVGWLDEVDECVGAYHDIVQAFATAKGVPTRRVGAGAQREVRIEDLKVLLAASQSLSRRGDHLVDHLGLRLESGEVVHGYDAVVR